MAKYIFVHKILLFATMTSRKMPCCNAPSISSLTSFFLQVLWLPESFAINLLLNEGRFQVSLRRQRLEREARRRGQEPRSARQDGDDSLHPLHAMHQVRFRSSRMRRPGNHRKRKQHAGKPHNLSMWFKWYSGLNESSLARDLGLIPVLCKSFFSP